MLEWIRIYLMGRFATLKEKLTKYEGNIMPKPRRRLDFEVEKSGNWIPTWAGAEKFQVTHVMRAKKFIVNLETKSCSCNFWELVGIPCRHAVAAITLKGGNPENFVHKYYHRDTYELCYGQIITPVNGVAQWPVTEYDTILPLAFKQGPGRPKKVRRREPEEESNPTKLRRTHTRQKCGRCHEVGHNSRRCTLPPPVPEEVPPAPQLPLGPQPPQAPNVPQEPQPQQVPNAPQEPQPPQALEAPQPTSTTVAAPPRRKYKKRSGSCSQPPPVSDKNATPDGSSSQPQPTDKGKKARKSNTKKGEKARSVAGKQVEDEGRSGTPSFGEARSAAPSAPQALPTAPSAPQPRSATPSAPRATSVAEPNIPPWAQKMTVGQLLATMMKRGMQNIGSHTNGGEGGLEGSAVAGSSPIGKEEDLAKTK